MNPNEYIIQHCGIIFHDPVCTKSSVLPDEAQKSILPIKLSDFVYV